MFHNSLINQTLQMRRDWGYNYFHVAGGDLYRSSAYVVLPRDSYMFRARIEGATIDIVQVPIGMATTEFLLHHGASVVRHLFGALGR